MKMTDGRRTVDITICRWNGNGYDPDWSRDYFSDVVVHGISYDIEKDLWTVRDVDYCIMMAMSTDEEGARCKWDEETETYIEDVDMEVWVEELGEMECEVAFDRWTAEYPYDEKICDASDDELLDWAENDETWNEFSVGCLHDLAWRHDLAWDVCDKYGDPEDADGAFERIKNALNHKGL